MFSSPFPAVSPDLPMSQTALSATSHAPGAGAPAGDIHERVTLVEAGGRTVGIPLTSVAAVLTPRETVRLPGASAPVVGVCNADGRIVSVVDAGLALAGAPVPHTPDTRLVVLDHRGLAMALLVAAVRGIVPAALERGSGDAALAGGFRTEETEGVLLDLEFLATRCFGG